MNSPNSQEATRRFTETPQFSRVNPWRRERPVAAANPIAKPMLTMLPLRPEIAAPNKFDHQSQLTSEQVNMNCCGDENPSQEGYSVFTKYEEVKVHNTPMKPKPEKRVVETPKPPSIGFIPDRFEQHFALLHEEFMKWRSADALRQQKENHFHDEINRLVALYTAKEREMQNCRNQCDQLQFDLDRYGGHAKQFFEKMQSVNQRVNEYQQASEDVKQLIENYESQKQKTVQKFTDVESEKEMINHENKKLSVSLSEAKQTIKSMEREHLAMIQTHSSEIDKMNLANAEQSEMLRILQDQLDAKSKSNDQLNSELQDLSSN